MPLIGFDQLFQEADAVARAVPVAVAGGADATVLTALRTAFDRGWVEPLVAGRTSEIRRTAEEHGLSLNGFTIIDAEEPATSAVTAVRDGRARMLMKGQVATPVLMRAVLDPTHGLRAGHLICQAPLMEIIPSGRRFLLADTGICVQPTLEQKRDMLDSCVELARLLGADEPRVALLSATETPTAAMPDTLEAAELARRGAAGEFGRCRVAGPLSFDLAYATDAADKKRVAGPVVGAADVMLFPNLLAANLTIKAMMYTADCRFGGVLLGATCPIVFMSRADSVPTRLRSLALALKIARAARAAIL
jgi:phosphate butyryltransferase